MTKETELDQLYLLITLMMLGAKEAYDSMKKKIKESVDIQEIEKLKEPLIAIRGYYAGALATHLMAIKLAEAITDGEEDFFHDQKALAAYVEEIKKVIANDIGYSL